MRPAIAVGVVRRISKPSPARILARSRAPAVMLAALLLAPNAARARTDAPPAPAAPATDAPPAFPPETAPPETPPPLREDAAPEPNVPSFEPGFGPRYHIEQIVVSGNHKTKTALILREIGLQPGDVISASDQRVEAARFRLLSRGFFLDVRLSLMRGQKRGGAILLVEVEERGTIVINELYPSTSEATTFWGGIDVSETNFLGRGINLGGAFVLSTTPKVPEARNGFGLRLHGSLPEIPSLGVSLSLTGLYNDGSEFYRVIGADTDPNPANFIAVRTRRVGGILGAGKPLGRYLRLFADLREEAVNGQLPSTRNQIFPSGLVRPIDFDVDEGGSRVGSLTLTLDYDTRPDPVLPRSGGRFVASIEGAHGALGSTYDFAKARRAGVGLHAPAARPRARLSPADGRPHRQRALLRSLLRRRSELAAAPARAGHELLDAGVAQPARHRHRRPPLRRLRGAHPDRVRDPDLAPPRLRLRRRRVRRRRHVRPGQRGRLQAA